MTASPNTKLIPLTQGCFAIIDADDFERVSKYKWFALKNGRTFYAERNPTIAPGKQRMLPMHRFIIGAMDGQTVDHINHNGLDNRKCNLRICNSVQNRRNSIKMIKPTTSKYKGVCWHSRDRVWVAYIKTEDRNNHLGNFKKEVDAANAYNKAAIEFYGAFAVLNNTSRASL